MGAWCPADQTQPSWLVIRNDGNCNPVTYAGHWVLHPCPTETKALVRHSFKATWCESEEGARKCIPALSQCIMLSHETPFCLECVAGWLELEDCCLSFKTKYTYWFILAFQIVNTVTVKANSKRDLWCFQGRYLSQRLLIVTVCICKQNKQNNNPPLTDHVEDQVVGMRAFQGYCGRYIKKWCGLTNFNCRLRTVTCLNV